MQHFGKTQIRFRIEHGIGECPTEFVQPFGVYLIGLYQTRVPASQTAGAFTARIRLATTLAIHNPAQN
jgi:hypothetical protein